MWVSTISIVQYGKCFRRAEARVGGSEKALHIEVPLLS
jgi:hypothetical protein